MDYTGIIVAGLAGALVGSLFAIPAFIKDWKKEHYANRPDKFQPNPNGTYRCPVCGMSNDSIKVCDGCNYIPPVLKNPLPPKSPKPSKKNIGPAAPSATPQPKPAPTSSTKKDPIDTLVKNGTVGLLATNTALFYYCVRNVLEIGVALNMGEALFATAIIDTAPYWKEGEISKGEIERAVEYAKAGVVRVGSYEISHNSPSSESELEMLCNLAMQLQAMKLFVDNNVPEQYPVNMVVDFKEQIMSIINDTIRAGKLHPKFTHALDIFLAYSQNDEFWMYVLNYGMDPDFTAQSIARMKAYREKHPLPPSPIPEIEIFPTSSADSEPAPPANSKPEPEPAFEPAPPANPAQDPGPSADDILAEMGKVEPAPPVPAQPTSIDISNLTDEQKALVAQLVDSMKK